MADGGKYLLLNIDDVKDMAPQFELGEVHEARLRRSRSDLTRPASAISG